MTRLLVALRRVSDRIASAFYAGKGRPRVLLLAEWHIDRALSSRLPTWGAVSPRP